MIDLIFDTETTRFPQWKLPEDHPEQTQLMELGILLTKGPDIILEWNQLVYCTQDPDPGAFNAHGISGEMCREAGVTLRQAVGFFHARLLDADRIVCHNVAFDRKVMLCAYAQANALIRADSDSRAEFDPNQFLSMPNICTMRTATNVVKIPHPTRSGYKWPTLQESYCALVDKDGFSDAHRAIHDAKATHELLCALRARNAEFMSAV